MVAKRKTKTADPAPPADSSIVAEPAWETLLPDVAERAVAANHWRRIVSEMTSREILSSSNGHSLQRLVLAYTARADALTDAQLESTIQEIRNALDAVSPAADDADLPAAPVDGMRDAINAATDRANRSAGSADPVR